METNARGCEEVTESDLVFSRGPSFVIELPIEIARREKRLSAQERTDFWERLPWTASAPRRQRCRKPDRDRTSHEEVAALFIENWSRRIIRKGALRAAADCGPSLPEFRRRLVKQAEELVGVVQSASKELSNPFHGLTWRVRNAIGAQQAHWLGLALSGRILQPNDRRENEHDPAKEGITVGTAETLLERLDRAAAKATRRERHDSYRAECARAGVIRNIAHVDVVRAARKFASVSWSEQTVEKYAKRYFSGKKVPGVAATAIDRVYEEKYHMRIAGSAK